ncbi:hypothetical protein FSP39_012337 [Pinctada imbricata]|uniref:Uncharacterized protein n=1 Tax=Pinctada imbricata TaxID=66713 RepID=A0AA88XE91_PINIB|nr:hypothetical protein FSP39_012337 [Pinctada imbricata]
MNHYTGKVALVIAKRRYGTSNINLYTDESTKALILLGYDETLIPNRNKKGVVLGYETFIKHPSTIHNEAIIFSRYQAQLKDLLRKEYEDRITQTSPVKDLVPIHSLEGVQLSRSETSQSFNLSKIKSIKKCIKSYSSRLWQSHSNLRIISADTEKIKNGKSIKKECIVFYCLSKGYIPLGEKHFPKYLQVNKHVFETDVREGHFVPGPKTKNLPTTSKMGYLDSFNEPLCMGSNIGKENKDETGTLGLFVNVSGDTKGFITCCHVLFDCTQKEQFKYLSWYKDIKYSVLQPGKSAFCGRPDKKCGEIEKAVFYPNKTPSVDAALVRITDREPTSGHFAIRNKNQVKELGYNENDYPNYVQGKVRRVIKETDLDLPVLKSGSTTGLTRSNFKLDGTEVRIFEEGNLLGMKDRRPIVMKGQYEILPGSEQNPFFIPGDSGSAVFLREPDKSLVCIGIAFGKTTYNTTLVTPIGAVLDSLGLDDKSVTHFE